MCAMRGGQIGPYLESLVALRTSGDRVIIDGPCLIRMHHGILGVNSHAKHSV